MLRLFNAQRADDAANTHALATNAAKNHSRMSLRHCARRVSTLRSASARRLVGRGAATVAGIEGAMALRTMAAELEASGDLAEAGQAFTHAAAVLRGALSSDDGAEGAPPGSAAAAAVAAPRHAATAPHPRRGHKTRDQLCYIRNALSKHYR